MPSLARRRIRKNIEAHARGEDATYLDLGNCGMTEVPEEIGGLMRWRKPYICHSISKL